jgi:hypothetical protein
VKMNERRDVSVVGSGHVAGASGPDGVEMIYSGYIRAMSKVGRK